MHHAIVLEKKNNFLSVNINLVFSCWLQFLHMQRVVLFVYNQFENGCLDGLIWMIYKVCGEKEILNIILPKSCTCPFKKNKGVFVKHYAPGSNKVLKSYF